MFTESRFWTYIYMYLAKEKKGLIVYSEKKIILIF